MVPDAVPTPRFGANYTPAKGWFHHWLDFDLAAVERDFDALASLGIDHLRVFALWPYFQPHRGLIREQPIEQLLSMVRAAADRGMDCSVDALQGHLSSFDFLPAWARTWHQGNLFTDPRILEGQSSYLRELASALAAEPTVLGMSLGNEFSQFASPMHPDREQLSRAQADDWLTTMLAACETGAPGLEHCHSEYDAAFFDPKHPFTPASTARHGALSTVHSWIFNGTAQRYGGLSEQSVRLAEYLIEVARGWAVDPHRGIWLQEIGAPAPHISAAEAAEFTERSLRHALDCEGLWGTTWWCSHDVSRELLDFPELEYSLGLLDNSQQIKPQGEVFAEMARQSRSGELPLAAPRSTALVLDVGDEVEAPGRATCAPGGEFFEAWMSQAMAGARPTVVLASQADDAELLAARGIQELIRPGR
ncbi:glycoside hydrolase 5 family protein [Psychromicrobium xiongbiense]|uniref:glycoside hydrolase 5 family protein n=1 Tax=Psychromicrobium xiongbiense TaxID=3051184 RepID=UPI0025522498|nr:glycosyl hydrolase [Psychromicrobium sp. YIM S02556]